MRIRASHIAFAVIAAISVFVVFAVTRTRADVLVDVGDPEFIERASSRSTTPSVSQGLLPGEGEDPDKVPKIVLEADAVAFGPVPNDDVSVHEFMVTNAGDRALVIDQIQTTCACTIGYFGDELDLHQEAPLATIAPGETVPMNIQIDPFRINGWETTKTLTIWSNDSARRQVTLDVTSIVEKEFDVSEITYEFGKVQRGMRHKGTVLVRQMNDPNFELLGAVATGNAKMPAQPGVAPAAGGELVNTFDLRVIKLAESQWQEPGKKEWAVEISLSPDLPPNPFRGYYELETNIERLERLRCSFRAVIESMFRVVPEVLSLPPGLESGHGRVGTATVLAEAPISVKVASVEGQNFVASVEPGDDSKSAKVHVDVEPGLEPGPAQATVRLNIEAEDGSIYEHKLNVRVRIH
jgi:hypothetical protein